MSWNCACARQGASAISVIRPLAGTSRKRKPPSPPGRTSNTSGKLSSSQSVEDGDRLDPDPYRSGIDSLGDDDAAAQLLRAGEYDLDPRRHLLCHSWDDELARDTHHPPGNSCVDPAVAVAGFLQEGFTARADARNPSESMGDLQPTLSSFLAGEAAAGDPRIGRDTRPPPPRRLSSGAAPPAPELLIPRSFALREASRDQ